MIKHAYMYGLELAAKEAGYSSWEEFYKQASSLYPGLSNAFAGGSLGAAMSGLASVR